MNETSHSASYQHCHCCLNLFLNRTRFLSNKILIEKLSVCWFYMYNEGFPTIFFSLKTTTKNIINNNKARNTNK